MLNCAEQIEAMNIDVTWAVLKDILQKVEWEEELEDLSTNLAWDKIKEKIYEAIEASTPMARPSGRQRKPWMNRETLASVRKKHQLFRCWLATRNAQDCANYLKARNEARKACRKAQKNTEMKLASEAKTNPNGVWKCAKSMVTCKSGIPDLKKEDGSRMLKRLNFWTNFSRVSSQLKIQDRFLGCQSMISKRPGTTSRSWQMEWENCWLVCNQEKQQAPTDYRPGSSQYKLTNWLCL